MRYAFLTLFLVLAAAITTPQPTLAAPGARPATAGLEHAVLGLINADRRAARLPTLAFGPRLAQVARAHSQDMLTRHYVSHFSPDGASPLDRITRSGIRYRVAGENIGWDHGFDKLQMLRDIEGAMLRSPEHRANLLRSSFTRVGVGIALSGNRIYVTEDFTG